MQKSNKNEIFMARVKNSNCLNFCTQVDPSKTRKAVYFFSSNMFLFSRKTNFSLFDFVPIKPRRTEFAKTSQKHQDNTDEGSDDSSEESRDSTTEIFFLLGRGLH